MLLSSLEPSHRDGSNEGSQHLFSLRNKKNYLQIILCTPSYVELCVVLQLAEARYMCRYNFSGSVGGGGGEAQIFI